MTIQDIYSVASGQAIYGGMSAPSTALPAWLQGLALNTAMAIPNSSGAGGAPVQAYGGYADDRDNSVLYSVLNGGHGDSWDNRVTKFDLSKDSPSWVLCSNPNGGLDGSPSPSSAWVNDANYYSNGKPVSRHNYDHAHWIPQVNRIILAGGFGSPPNGNGVTASDGFSPTTNLWDAAGTWPFTAGVGYGIAADYVNGWIWTNGLKRYNPQTKTYDLTISNPTVTVRYPAVYDRTRNQIFCLMWGDGAGFGTPNQLNASAWSSNGGTQRAITFNASAAFTQFQSEYASGAYAGMTYDDANDCFYWYSGGGSSVDHIYVIKPNSSSAWDMTLLPLQFASGLTTLGVTISSGMNGRIKFFPKLKGFIVCPSGTGTIYFVRTA